MSIAITTPTGHIGSRVTQLLIQAGVRPTLLVRDPARLAPEVRAASDARQGNLNDPNFLLQATEGAEALFLLIPTDYVSEDPIADIIRVGGYAAKAIEKNRIARTVLISSAGADLPDIGFIGALGEVEKLLNATGANVVHLRPGYFFTNLVMSLDPIKQGVLPTTTPLDHRSPWNDPKDVAEVAAARLLARDWTGQIVQPLSGPENLTFAEVAAIVTEVTGHPVQAIHTTEEDSRAAMLGAGLSPAAAEGFLAMARGITRGLTGEYGREFASILPTSLREWAYTNLRPLLAK